MRAGSRADHDRFCRTEKWTLVRDARGRAVRHHVTFELSLDDGRVLRTRISRPVDTTTYGPGLWKAILRDQLDVSEDDFWDCVRAGRPPDRGRADVQAPARAIPAGLLHQVINVAHVPDDRAKTLTLDEALAVMAEHWGRPPGS